MVDCMPPLASWAPVPVTRFARIAGHHLRAHGRAEQFNQAQLVLWLKREGLFEPIETQLQAVGSRSLVQELPHMYVSNHLAKALLAVRPWHGQ